MSNEQMDDATRIEYMPANETEQRAAAFAVYDERQRQEADALVDNLTERERLLIETVWVDAICYARTELAQRLASPHAVTLDAAAVRQAVERWSAWLSTDPPPALVQRGWHRDQRIANIVRTVDRMTAERTRRAQSDPTP